MSDFLAQIDSPTVRLAIVKITTKSHVRTEEKFGRISKKTPVFHSDAKMSDDLNNGVMLRFPPGSFVTVRVRPHNVLGVE